MIKRLYLEQATIYYPTQGIELFPLHTPQAGGCSCGNEACASVGKHPRVRYGAKAATSDPDIIRKWWQRWPEANIGINVGRSGLVVIDVDPDHGGRVGALPLTAAGRYTTIVRTGGAGWHLWYEAPPGLNISNSNKRGPPGVDIRAGEGAYVVAPPSLHASGDCYAFVEGREPWSVAPRPLPASLLPILTIRNYPEVSETRSSMVSQSMPRLDADHPYVVAALHSELEELAQAREGARNDMLNKSAFSLGQFVGIGLLARAEVEGLLERAAVAIGLGELEARNTIRSGLEAGINTPRHNWPDFD